tara:strand:- start:2438 stop:2827 length:390 start_codon:yes stop_codon:yes gene_type:complete
MHVFILLLINVGFTLAYSVLGFYNYYLESSIEVTILVLGLIYFNKIEIGGLNTRAIKLLIITAVYAMVSGELAQLEDLAEHTRSLFSSFVFDLTYNYLLVFGVVTSLLLLFYNKSNLKSNNDTTSLKNK